MLVCDKCGVGITAGARFCAQCGDPVTDADRSETIAPEASVARVEISFGYSSSPNYARAVSMCENIPSYEVSGEGRGLRHVVTLPITEVEFLASLYDLVGGWRSSRMLIDGRVETKQALTYGGVGCYRSRQQAFNPQQYCYGEKQYDANIWGCKRLNMPVSAWAGWIDCGAFDDSGAWHFDKRRIRHDLEVAMNDLALCPALDRRRILETLENLPDAIDPKVNTNWQYKTSYQRDENGEYRNVAVGIQPNFQRVNAYVTGDFKPTWEPDAEQSTGVVSDAVESIPPFSERLSKSRQEQNPPGMSSEVKILLIVAGLIALAFFFS